METFPEDLFATVKARIVSGDERQEMGVLGDEGGWASEGHGIAVSG